MKDQWTLVKKGIRSLAKKSKQISYSTALVVMFLMLGNAVFSAETQTILTREDINQSISGMQDKFASLRRENNHRLDGARMKFIKLMEQGDQVVKSPWASWQFGLNYFYADYGRTYRGRGDKEEKYPYEGILKRDDNEMNRYISPESDYYSSLKTYTDPKSASTNGRGGDKSKNLSYGIVNTKQEREPIVKFDIQAEISPRTVQKDPLVINPELPALPKEPKVPVPIAFKPPVPTIVIPEDPALPVPPTFAVFLGADCNNAYWCSSLTKPNGTSTYDTRDEGYKIDNYTGLYARQSGKGNPKFYPGRQNVNSQLHYTWYDRFISEESAKGLAFKMYAEPRFKRNGVFEGIDFTLGEHAAPFPPGQATPNPNQKEWYFNSYNTGEEFTFPISPSKVMPDGIDKNKQYFFVGGSRFIEADNTSTSFANKFTIPEGHTVHLGGIFTIALVSQGDKAHLLNEGVITDREEKEDDWIKNMPTDLGKNYLTIRGATEDYQIQQSEDGYVGYKTGMALVTEDGVYTGLSENKGVIDFRGERSMGIYTYLPEEKVIFQAKEYEVINDATQRNAGVISLSGKESYGMKIAAKSASQAKMVNSGDINLRKNPDGVDKADSSAAMALMKDDSVKLGVSFPRGKAINEKNIYLSDVENSLGMYVNIDTDMKNEGNILINSSIPKAITGSQALNLGMRADGVPGAEVINEGKIELGGSYAIGMLAKNAQLKNRGEITSTDIKHGIGIVGIDNAKVENSGLVEVVGTGETSNIGIFLNKNSQGSIGTPKAGAPAQAVEVKGDKSTGVLVSGGSSLEMTGNVTVSGNSVTGIVANDTKITATAGTVKVSNDTAAAGELNGIGSYGIVVKGANGEFKGDTVDTDIHVSTQKSVGLYAEDGKIVVQNGNVTTEGGAFNYYVKGSTGQINFKGAATKATTGQASTLFLADNGGSFKIDGKMEATIKGSTEAKLRGNAFLYKGNGYSKFDDIAIGNWANSTFQNSLSNLKLIMESGSRLFVAQDVSMDLSVSDPAGLTTHLGATIQGNDYKTFMLYLSKLKLDQNINLDDANNNYNKIEITNSSIENLENNQVTGSQAGQVFIAQENDAANPVDKVQLINKGSISLTGADSTAIYGKHAELINEATGTIQMGEGGAALYGVEASKVVNKGKIDLASKATGLYGKASTLLNEASGEITVRERGTAFYGLDDSSLENKGKIVLAESSTGMYAKDGVNNGIKNSGSIEGAAEKSIAMVYDGNHAAAVGAAGRPTRLENTATGKIALTGDASIAMYGLGSGYNMDNFGEISLGESSDQNNPSIGMFAASDSVRSLNNAGAKIQVGKNGVGIFGYEVANDGTIEAADNAVAIYSKGPKVELGAGSKITVGKDKAVGGYLENGGILNNNGDITVGEESFGFVASPGATPFKFTGSANANVSLGKNSIYLYSTDRTGEVINHSSLQASTEGGNYGIYSAGLVKNYGDIDFSSSLGNVGILTHMGGSAENFAHIKVGDSKVSREPGKSIYSVAMGTVDGSVTNRGDIDALGESSVAMYGKGASSKVYNYSNINLAGDGSMGIYLDEKAYGENHGNITTVGNPRGAIGVVVRGGSTLENHGNITINSTKGFAGILLSGGVIKNYGTMTLNGETEKQGELPNPNNKDEKFKTTKDLSNQKTGKDLEGVEIVVPAAPPREQGIYQNGLLVTAAKPNVNDPVLLDNVRKYVDIPAEREALTSPIGMYIDTVTPTKPIGGLNTIDIDAADLIIGVEAARLTNSKHIKVSDPKILDPYRQIMIANPRITTWNIYAGSLSWLGTASFSPNGLMENLYLAKVPYTAWAGDQDSYNFTDGLEQLYGREEWGSRERLLFDKLNSIGNNEETLLYQAYDEMMGHQYANVQQRIHATGGILDKEFRYLRREWTNMSKDSNKVKAFGMNGEYKTSTAGIIDYKNYAQGLAYVHEDETVKLGLSSGWYAGFVRNEFKFQDIGRSKEEMYQGKVGYFRNYSFDNDGSLQWHIAGEGFLGHSKLNRRYLVVDDIFRAKSKFWSYGLGLKNEVSKEFRLSEDFKLRPYAMLDLEYGRFQKIRERSGEVRLEVKANDYYSIRPEVGVELAHKFAFGKRNLLKTSIGVAYENELGKVGEVKNKARVAYTTADHFGLRGEKEDRRGNIKADLKLGLENTSYGVTANIGYDTKGSNIRAGLGLRVIF